MSSENENKNEITEATLLEIFNRLEKKLDAIIHLLEEANDTDDDDEEDLAEDEEDVDIDNKRKGKPFGKGFNFKQSNGFTHPGTCKRFVPRYNPYYRRQ